MQPPELLPARPRPTRPPAPPLPRLGCETTSRALADKRRSACEALFVTLLQACASASLLWMGIKDSPSRTQHLHQLLLALAHTTLTKYLKAVANFLDWLQSFACSLADIAWPCLADFLYAASRSSSEDRACHRLPPLTAIKSLRWFARVAQVPALQEAMHAPLVASYATSGEARDRREAFPLPMALVCEWERKITRHDCPLPLRLWLGGALLCVHASLRWGDAQRIEWSSLSLTSTCLHGTCYRTKTSSQGQPFAVHVCGFTGHLPSTCWVLAWLKALTEARAAHPQAQPDFVFPLSGMHATSLPALCPSSYHHSLQTLRWAATLPWHEWWDPNDAQALTPAEARQLGLHSLKSCLLAAAAQLRLPKDDRLGQGHHRDSARLYSRDDTIASLAIQEQVRAALLRGWRPQRSQARGGQAPVPEPPLRPLFTTLWKELLHGDLSQPAIRPWVTRQELTFRPPDRTPANPSPTPPRATASSLPPQPASPRPASLDSEAAAVERWAALHPDSSSSEPASPVASDPPSDADNEPAPSSPKDAPSFSCVTTGPWAALHCIDPASQDLYRASGDASQLRPLCGARLASTRYMAAYSAHAQLCGRAACKQARESLLAAPCACLPLHLHCPHASCQHS